ncbi:Rz1-like lysis system protein LysC [Symbiopectobacterium sp. RP]|uniref:Rz1-like lysis system protein LysC n=1 Tax=Symbiopectobacterium sp. RP TaxID=3248553 RepID=UPI003D2BA295
MAEPIPESLTTPTPTPALRTPVTWGGIALWSDHLREALDTCNDDKAVIGDLYWRRLQRINAAAQNVH